MTTTQALKRQRNFSARGSLCPICKAEFNTCQHSVVQATDRLTIDVIRSIKTNNIK